jgi:hypothetical protein
MTINTIAAVRRLTLTVVTLALAVATIAAAPLRADELFSHGQFERAKAEYASAATQDPADASAILGLARIALYENNLDAAAAYAAKVLALRADDALATRVVQTIAERRAIVASAATLGVPDAGVVIPFLESEPLPAIRLSVNGKPGTFLLDTGGADLTFDPAFAAECGLTVAGGREGTFLGGRTAQVREAVADRIDIGGLLLKDLKATVLPTRGMRLFPKRDIDGVAGTVFLSRFQATIDFPHRRLVLRPRAAEPLRTASSHAVPMWLVGDHFIFALGSVNGLASQLFSVDTGGAGVGFMPVAETVAAAHIKTFPDKAFEALGGGGRVKAIPTEADRVCLADVCQRHVGGGYTPTGSPLTIFPFAASGSVSHEFFKKYAVTFDFVRMLLLLTPASDLLAGAAGADFEPRAGRVFEK